MMIDGSMMDKPPGANYSLSDFGEYHWVVYEGGLEILNKDETPESDYDKVTNINFNVATWGKLRCNKNDNKITITKEQFIANYYGYLKFK
ncbi:hypothetical protein PG911_06405 [Tenacibaculum ovolyticum]|uniref:hypothetical protein n=1 Tax=Tenacibaculum ovolyticum TaxID=104270 RepID=UPI0022F3EEF3|nr:hypothetical protein [Tenacibaculum ovolyticum]WBX77882.1 hypothetical protein PG911_06405 [Tenacibaculum ovolyticum]